MPRNRLAMTRYGAFLYNSLDLYIGTSIELYGEYAEHEMELLRSCIVPGAVVFDVGAHIGTHTLVFSQAAGPDGFVYAFEPQRVVFQTLCANVALNSIENVECIHAAAGSKMGFVSLPPVDYMTPGNFGMVSTADEASGEAVRMLRLDSTQGLDRLDFIKIDVEGNELDVLRGADQLIGTFRPLLYVENDRIEKSEALIRHLLGLNYRVFWHLPLLFNKNNHSNNPVDVTEGRFSVNMLCVPTEQPAEFGTMVEIADPAEHPLKGAAAPA